MKSYLFCSRIYAVFIAIIISGCAHQNKFIQDDVSQKLNQSHLLVQFRVNHCDDKKISRTWPQYWHTRLMINEKINIRKSILGGENIKITIPAGDVKIDYILESDNNCDTSYVTGNSFFGFRKIKKLSLHVNEGETAFLRIVNVDKRRFGCGCIGGGGNPLFIPIPEHYQDVALEVEKIEVMH